MIKTGKVKWFSEAKGYGFITSDENAAEDIFVHFSAINGKGFKTLSEGQLVQFTVVKDQRGQRAENVELI